MKHALLLLATAVTLNVTSTNLAFAQAAQDAEGEPVDSAPTPSITVTPSPTPIAAIPDFPADYYDSRARFRAACPVSPDENTFCEMFNVDPRDDLTVDTLFWRAQNSQKILVLVSGVHGIESYAGATVQRDFVEEQLSRFLDQGISVYLVHALNPWGYRHNARVTANNIDLNRNFPSVQDRHLAPNAGFQKLKEILAPENIGGPGLWSFLGFSFRLLWKIATFQFTVDEMNQAVAGGQREEPRGLFYGGQAVEPQIEWLKNQLDGKLAGFREALLIDLHTGLGDRGSLHLMPSDEPATSGRELRERLFGKESNDIYQITTGNTKGFYTVAGDFLDFAEERGPRELSAAAMTMEFGTKGTSIPAQLGSLHTMAAENAKRQVPWGPGRERDVAATEEQFFELFAPRDSAWRESVRQKSRAFFSQVLSHWSAAP